MSHPNDETHYALARQVPDMARGFTVHTNYGDLQIEPEEAAAFIRLTKSVLMKRIAKSLKERYP